MPTEIETKALEAAEAVMREGDIYRWRWKDEGRHNDQGPYRSYHCKSRIAVFRNGHLYDTFWPSGGSDNWIDPDQVEITLWANTAELTEIRHYDVPYYRREDIVDLRHSNNSSGPIYRLNGAERDAETMLVLIEEKLQEHRREIASALNRIEDLGRASEKVKSGRLTEVYL